MFMINDKQCGYQGQPLQASYYDQSLHIMMITAEPECLNGQEKGWPSLN